MSIRAEAVRGLLISAAALAVATPAWAQTEPQPAEPAADQAEERVIVVTGTRRTDRSVTDSASPIDVISSADLQQQPTPNMLDAVKNPTQPGARIVS